MLLIGLVIMAFLAGAVLGAVGMACLLIDIKERSGRRQSKPLLLDRPLED